VQWSVLGDLRVGLLVGRAVLAWSGWNSVGTQGVALGWYAVPRWGWESRRVASRKTAAPHAIVA